MARAAPKCTDSFDGAVRRLEANGVVDPAGHVLLSYFEIGDGRIGPPALPENGPTSVEVRDATGALITTFAPESVHSEPVNAPIDTSVLFWLRRPVDEAVTFPLTFTSFRDGMPVSTTTAGGRPPKAVASGVVKSCHSPRGAWVVLDGHRSFDPDGDTIYFEWTTHATILHDADTPRPRGFFPPGRHAVELEVKDGSGLSDKRIVFVIVQGRQCPLHDNPCDRPGSHRPAYCKPRLPPRPWKGIHHGHP